MAAGNNSVQARQLPASVRQHRQTPPLSGVEQLGLILSVAVPADPDLGGMDFELAASTAMNWRMGGTLFEAIQAQGIEDRFSCGALGQLRGAYFATVMRNRVLRSRVAGVLKAFSAEGLQPILLKGGIQLLMTPQRGECSRFMEDVDILVAPSEYEHAEAIVRREGFIAHVDYEPSFHHGPELRDRTTGIKIEIHRRPLPKDRPDYSRGLVDEAMTIVAEEGLRIRVPSPRYRLLHNMMHAQESHENFLLGTADMRHLHEFAVGCTTLGAQFDWPWLVSSAAQYGLRTHLIAWTYAAHRIFGLPLPAGVTPRWVERNQFTRIRRSEERGRYQGFADRILHVHVLAAQGGMSLGDVLLYYRQWARHLRRG
jgi:hypothetical protein